MSVLRRLALPLAVSLGLHALLIGAACLSPFSQRVITPGAGPQPAWRVSLDGPRQKRRVGVAFDEKFEPRVEPLGPGIDVHLAAPAVAADGPGDGPPGGGSSQQAAVPTAPGRSLLAAPGEARRVAYVVDRSVSMGTSGALKRAAEEVSASLRRLPAGASFLIVAYNHIAAVLPPGDWSSGEASVADAERHLSDLPASGPTHHVRALQRTLQARPDLIFLITDAGDLSDADVHLIARLNQGRAAIHVVELAAGRSENGPLARVAETNRGTYRRVSPE